MSRARLIALAAGGVAAGTGTILMGVGLVAASGYLVSRAGLRPPIAELMLVFVAVRFFGLGRPALRYVERVASHDLTFRLLALVRGRFVERLLPLSHGQLAAFRSGDLLSRLASDVDALQDAWLRVVSPALVAILTTGVLFTALLLADARLAWAVLALLAFHGVAWSWVAHRIEDGLGAARNEERRVLTADVVMVLQGLEDVLAFGYEDRALAKFADRQRTLDDVERRYGWRLGIHATVATAASYVAFWTSLALTSAKAQTGELGIAWVAAISVAVLVAFEAVDGLPAAWQFGGQARESAARVAEVARMKPAVAGGPNCVPLGRSSPPSIQFRHVSFGYDTRSVLEDFSLRIDPGEHVAIVGPTGCGKSTVLELLMRAWDPRSGTVLVDGHDLRQVSFADLRAATAVMPQQIHVFNTSVRENVRLGRPTATDAEALGALERAGLGEFMGTLADGLDTTLGEHGARMSAGERRRLGFARLLLTDAPLVLLDEPTAHLDDGRERELLRELRVWASGRTVLLVTHRPAALEFVDHVLRLRDS